MRIWDVTLPIYPGMPVYEGDPKVTVRPWLSIPQGAPANVSVLSLGSHTGTHLDAPVHFLDGALGVDELPLEVLIGPARLYSLSILDHIDAACLRGLDLASRPRILFKTRNAAVWQQGQSDREYAALTADAARLLVEAGVRLVGLDAPSADPWDSGEFPAHHTLLRAGVIILEGLDLTAVPPGEYELLCLPLKIRGGDGAPARVLLREGMAAAARPPRAEDGTSADPLPGA